MARTRVTPGDWLRSLGACKEGIAWLGDKSVYHAWRYCPHADYLCWLFGALDAHLGVAAAIAIARHLSGGTWPDQRLESLYDDLYRWSSGGFVDAHVIRLRAHKVQTELNEHPLSKALTWAAVCATAATPALAGEAASLSCVASFESFGDGVERATLSETCAGLLRSTVSVASVEQAWKRTVRALTR